MRLSSRSKTGFVQVRDSSPELEMEPLFDDLPRDAPAPEPKKPKQKASYRGLVMAVGSSLMFSLCSVIVKWLTSVPETELAVFRFVGVLLPSLPMLIYRSEAPYPTGYRRTLLLRGLFGTTSLLLQFYAFRHMPLADASVIVFSMPAFVAIFARIFLKEPCGKFEWLLIVLTLSGVVIIARPPWLFGSLSGGYSWDNWKGSIAAMIGTVVAACVYIILRKLKKLHFTVVMTDFALIGLIITPIVTVVADEPVIPACGVTRWLIVAIAVLSFGGQMLLTKALQIEQAGPVSIARTSDIVFAFIWQIIFFGETPDILSIAGAALVTSCVVLLAVRRWLLSLPLMNRTRRSFKFLTS